MPTLQAARVFFDQLNQRYNAVHKTKEELFWATYMATSSDQAGFALAEQAFKAFISEPENLVLTREHLAQLERLAQEQQASQQADELAALQHGLRGWQALFEANIVDSAQGRVLMQALIEAEAVLFAKKRELQVTHLNERGESEAASLSMLATNAATNPVEAYRRSSFEGFEQIEAWVLANGLLDIIKLRNRLARALGFSNYFELKLRKNERMTPAALMAILDDFVQRTQGAHERCLADLRARFGEQALQPWNLRFHSSGDVVRRMDAYMPFGPALRRWVDSFKRLGIDYRGATLQLDLLERPGKYQNGFCHSPVPCYVDAQGRWVPAAVNFTATAKPDQLGSGLRGINTLFHEGGHAAHMSNVAQNSPCFAQEFAPTSMAYAETQSMFCDSLLNDADWLKRYAKNAAGEAMPDELIHARIASSQPMRAFEERSIAVVPYFEAALYAMADEELTADAVLALARATELRVLGVVSPRPMLAIPHLLNQESAASYQGYLLAHMAVYQTRAHFLKQHGYLCDNPAIGPAMREHFWVPGNSIDHDATLRSLTGEGFSARYLAEACNESVAEAWAREQRSLAAAEARAQSPLQAALAHSSLDAQIRVIHGAELIADNTQGDDAMCAAFEGWVARHFPASPALS